MKKLIAMILLTVSSVPAFASMRQVACGLSDAQVKSIVSELSPQNPAPSEDADEAHQAVYIHLMSEVAQDYTNYLSGHESINQLVQSYRASCRN